jgi:hypothetical protein
LSVGARIDNFQSAAARLSFARRLEEIAMWKRWCLVTLAIFVAWPALAQSSFPDLRGTWKGESESIVTGAANPHHTTSPQPEPRLTSASFTLTIDKQDGRRFSGAFSSARSNESIVGVISHTGTLFFVDSDGYAYATLLGPDKLESCYLQIGANGRVASCTVLTKQP